MLKRTTGGGGTSKQTSKNVVVVMIEATTNLSRLIVIIGNPLRIDLFSVAATVRDKNVWWENQ